MRFRLGEFGSPIKPWSEVGPNVVGAAAHAKLALQAARESITLLRNDGILPLETSRSDPIAALALIGPLADSTAVMEGSKQDYMAAHIVSIKEGIETFLKGHPNNLRVQYAPGLNAVKDENTSTAAYKAAVEMAVASDVALLVVGIDGGVEAEADNPNVLLQGHQEQLAEDVAAGRAEEE